MSVISKKIIYIDVTKGDCKAENRTSGKSNTGTYFISSIGDFERYSNFFKENKPYKFDSHKINLYKMIFKNFCFRYRDKFPGQMNDFEFNCDQLINGSNPITKITLRSNDTRVFMRFEDNLNSYVNCFRSILYEKLSRICIEEKDDVFLVYPEVKDDAIESDEIDFSVINDEDELEG